LRLGRLVFTSPLTLALSFLDDRFSFLSWPRGTSGADPHPVWRKLWPLPAQPGRHTGAHFVLPAPFFSLPATGPPARVVSDFRGGAHPPSFFWDVQTFHFPFTPAMTNFLYAWTSPPLLGGGGGFFFRCSFQRTSPTPNPEPIPTFWGRRPPLDVSAPNSPSLQFFLFFYKSRNPGSSTCASLFFFGGRGVPA